MHDGAADSAGYEDRVARLRLMRTAQIGPVTYAQLLARFGSAADALAAIPELARRGGGKAPPIATRAAIDTEISAVERAGARYLFLGQPHYPPLLAQLTAAPPALIIAGDRTLLERPAVLQRSARATRRRRPAASRVSWRRSWGAKA